MELHRGLGLVLQQSQSVVLDRVVRLILVVVVEVEEWVVGSGDRPQFAAYQDYFPGPG